MFLLDVVSSNRLNKIKKEGCIKKNCPAGGKKVFQQNWGNAFIYARQPVFASIVHLLLPEGKLLSASLTVCTSGLRQMHLMHTTAFKIGRKMMQKKYLDE